MTNVRNVQGDQSNQSENDVSSDEFCYHVSTKSHCADKWRADIHVGTTKDKMHTFIIDTGSQVTIVPVGVIHPKVIKPSSKVLTAAFSNSTQVKGVYETQLRYKDKCINAEIFIVENSPFLLGANEAEGLGLVTRAYNVESKLGKVDCVPVGNQCT